MNNNRMNTLNRSNNSRNPTRARGLTAQTISSANRNANRRLPMNKRSSPIQTSQCVQCTSWIEKIKVLKERNKELIITCKSLETKGNEQELNTTTNPHMDKVISLFAKEKATINAIQFASQTNSMEIQSLKSLLSQITGKLELIQTKEMELNKELCIAQKKFTEKENQMNNNLKQNNGIPLQQIDTTVIEQQLIDLQQEKQTLNDQIKSLETQKIDLLEQKNILITTHELKEKTWEMERMSVEDNNEKLLKQVEQLKEEVERRQLQQEEHEMKIYTLMTRNNNLSQQKVELEKIALEAIALAEANDNYQDNISIGKEKKRKDYIDESNDIKIKRLRQSLDQGDIQNILLRNL